MVGEYKFFEDVIVAAEKGGEEGSAWGAGNRLIIACNRDDWKRLEVLIEKLDKPQPQVAMEVLIVNIDANLSKQLGAQHYGFFGKKLGLGINEFETYNLSQAHPKSASSGSGSGGASGATNSVQQYIQLAGSEYEGISSPSFMTLGRAAAVGGDPAKENIWSIIKAVFNITNSNVISQPFLVANNNQKCNITASFKKRIPGKLISNKGEPVRQEQEEKEAKTSVDITPRINLGGYVDLNINVSIDEFNEGVPGQIIINTRMIETQSRMLAGEVLVLGGLTRSDMLESEYKTPILGDIPILGSLFKNKTRTRHEANLYVFIRPSIIKPRFEGGADEYTQLKLDYAKYQMMKNDSYVKDKDPVQRWYFKPTNHTVKQKVDDWKKGLFRPIDDYAQGKYAPREVNISEDPYFKVSEALEKKKKERRALKEKKKRSEQAAETITLA
jgi:general secretion pathway protein D